MNNGKEIKLKRSKRHVLTAGNAFKTILLISPKWSKSAKAIIVKLYKDFELSYHFPDIGEMVCF